MPSKPCLKCGVLTRFGSYCPRHPAAPKTSSTRPSHHRLGLTLEL